MRKKLEQCHLHLAALSSAEDYTERIIFLDLEPDMGWLAKAPLGGICLIIGVMQ